MVKIIIKRLGKNSRTVMGWKQQAKEAKGGCTVSAIVFKKSIAIQFMFYDDDDASMFLLTNGIVPDYSSKELIRNEKKDSRKQ